MSTIAAALPIPRRVPDQDLLPGLLLMGSLLMVMLPDGFLFGEFDPANFPWTGSWFSRIQWLPFFALAGYVILRRFRLFTVLLPQLNIFLLLTVLWMVASVLWSAFPEISSRRVIKMVGMVAIGIAFVLGGWHAHRFEDLARRAFLLIMGLSVVTIVVLPDTGLHQGHFGSTDLKGAWRGVTAHKNELGPTSAFAMMFFTQAWLARRASPGQCLFGIALALVCLLGTRSTTSLVMAVIGTGIVVSVLRANFLFSLPVILAGVSLAVAMLFVVLVALGMPNFQELMGATALALGKDVTFTGRLDIWVGLLDEIAKRPWLGHGYNAFWLGLRDGSPAQDLLRSIGFIVQQGHNGYLDFITELGLIGFALLLGFLVVHGVQLARVARINRPVFALHLAIFACFLLINMTEAAFFRPSNIFTLLPALSSAVVARMLLEERWRQARRSVGAPASRGGSSVGEGMQAGSPAGPG